MPLVPSRRSHSFASQNDPSDAERSDSTPPPMASRISSKSSEARGSKLTITSKRSVAESETRRSATREPMRSVSGNKRRKLTPEPDQSLGEEDGDNGVQSSNDEAEQPPRRSAIADPSQNGDDEPDVASDNDDELLEGENNPDGEIVIPVAEDYDSDDSETGMADSLDMMRKTFEEVPHAPGAIVRVDLENFVTYTKVTFEPGPSLNMVIGPNGTGKSTLVCAICLGLGFGVENLGRANDVAEFVKNGTDYSIIEIELMRDPKEEINPTFKRRINRDGTGAFWINGKKISQKAVREQAKNMNIQIDNLCQFLPQDRVVEFAGLGPVALLRETQRAAAPPEVLKDHEGLVSLHSKEVQAQTVLESDQQAMTTMENRQKVLERDVQKLKERERLQASIKLMQQLVEFKGLQELKEKRATIKEDHARLREELGALLEEEKPQADQIEAAANIRDNLKKWIDEEKVALKNLQANLQKEKERGVGAVKGKERKAESDRKLLIEAEKGRKKAIETTRAKISRFQKTIENDPGTFDPKEYNDKLEDLSKRHRHGIRTEYLECKAAIESLQSDLKEKITAVNSINKWLETMENAAGQRAEFLKRVNPEAYRVYNWLKENKARFKDEVYGPPMVECSVPASHRDEVEGLLGRGDMLAFTCTNKEDFDNLMLVAYGDGKSQRGMGLSQVNIRYIDKKLDSWPRIPEAELTRLGFDGVALDFIRGPEPVLSMLCDSQKLNRIGVAKKRFTPEQQDNIKKANIMNKWVSGGVITALLKRVEYGTETEMSNLIKESKLFKDQRVDQQRLNEKRQNKAELEDEIKDLQDAINSKTDKFREIESLNKELKEQMDAIRKEKEERQKEVNAFLLAKTRLENEEEKLSSLENDGEGFQEKLAELEALTMQLNMERVEAATIYAKHVRECIARFESLVVAELHLIEAASNFHHYNTWNDSFRQRKEAKQREIDEVKIKYAELETEISSKQKECKRIINSLSPEQQTTLKDMHSTKTVADLRADIREEELRLESIHEGNPHAIRQYEAREQEIQELRARMEEKEAKLRRLQAGIDQVRRRWEPRVDQLVNNISEAFSRSFEFINCAGAVRIKKEGKDGRDFENWQIEILVKFREEEQMQVLTAQRQSGGERAVSTVFYLMALQSLARAPFRVVDEINQGMDPRNERLVHKRMVKIACKKHTSQYFLITPKLLVDLDYHERMKILCINSGDWVAEDHVVDFGKYINAARKQ